MTTARGFLAGLAVVMLTSACGDDGKGAGGTTLPVHETAPVVTVATVAATTPTTSPSVTTTPPTTTSTTTTTTTTTTPATTTTTPLPVEDQIKQAIQDYFESYARCGEDPATCDPSGFLAPASEAWSHMTEFVANLLVEGRRFQPDDTVSYIVVTTVGDVAGDGATASSCWFDAGVIVKVVPGTSPPMIVSNDVASLHLVHQLRLINGKWLVSKELETSRDPGVDTCGRDS